MLAVASLKGLSILKSRPQVLDKLRENIRAFRKAFGNPSAAVELVGDELSPAMHVRLRRTFASRKEEDQALQKIVEMVRRDTSHLKR